MEFSKNKIRFYYKKRVSSIKMIRLTELRAMLKENKIRVYLHYNKSELVDVLVKRGLLPEIINITTITSLPEREDTKKEINHKYNFLKHIRNSPKKIEIRDIETGEIIVYSSMYKAANTFNQQSRLLSAYDGKYGGIDTLLKY